MDSQPQSESREQQMQQEEGNEDDDDLKQKQAFPFPQVDEDHEDYEAYQYLSKVRTEAIQLKLNDKKNQKREERKLMEEEKQSSEGSAQLQQSQEWQLVWRKQVIQHWKCVIQNIRYLRKTQQKISKSKIDLKTQPNVNQLALCLTVGRIQKLLSKVVEDFHQNKQKSSINHCLWIYSLLALHQSQAPYRNFQVLADLNAFIVCHHEKVIQSKIIKVLLKEYFSQHHLKF